MADPKFTPEVAKRIVDLIRAGNYKETATASAGINSRTFRKWMAEGAKQRDGHPKKQFYRDVSKAEAEAEAGLLLIIRTATKKHWQAAAWILERTHPAKFGQRVKVEVERELGGMLDKLKAKLTPGEYERVLQALATDDDVLGDERALSAGEDAALYPLDSERLDAE